MVGNYGQGQGRKKRPRGFCPRGLEITEPFRSGLSDRCPPGTSIQSFSPQPSNASRMVAFSVSVRFSIGWRTGPPT
ncbi:hypothetical protein PhaeoP48_00181 [Phaeobacter inhibens]|nr:hypothetical protein PhaeoP48_00181 [Phaeobacter inhibens]